MTKEEIREKIFNLQPGEKFNFVPKEYKDARAAIAEARKTGNTNIVSAVIGNSKSLFGHLSVYFPKNEGEKIVSADIKYSQFIGHIPVVALKKEGNSIWLILFDSGAETTIYDKKWLMESRGLTEEEIAGDEETTLTGIGGKQSVKTKKLKVHLGLEATDGRHVILRTSGLSSDLSGINERLNSKDPNEKVMIGAIIGTDVMTRHLAVIDFNHMSIRLHDLIQSV